MNQTTTSRLAFGSAFLLLFGAAACNRSPERNDPNGTSPKVQTQEERVEKEVVASGLDNPCGIAVQPETGHVFVSMKERIVRLVPGPSYGLFDEVVGFPTDKFGRGPEYEFGPLGLTFLDKDTLIVGDGSLPDGEELVRFYAVGSAALPKDKVPRADVMKGAAGPIPSGKDSLGGEGNFFGVAVAGNTLFVTGNGDDAKGWISKVDLSGGASGKLNLVPCIKSKELTHKDAPMGAAISPEGKLVVCQFGSTTELPDSLLTFYDLDKVLKSNDPDKLDNEVLKKFEAHLRDLCAVAYSPKTGKLYGVDFSWAEPEMGGLFRLEIQAGGVKPVKLAALDKPTGLAFAPDGTLYVTQLGKGENEKTGQVLKFKGL